MEGVLDRPEHHMMGSIHHLWGGAGMYFKNTHTTITYSDLDLIFLFGLFGIDQAQLYPSMTRPFR